MRALLRRTAVSSGCLVLALLTATTPAAGAASTRAAPSLAPSPLSRPDLGRLEAELAAVAAHARQLTDELDAAAARDGGLRVDLERLTQQRGIAQQRLDVRARQVYMATQVDPLAALQFGVAEPDLREFARRGQQAALTVDRTLVDGVTRQGAELTAVRRRAEAFRTRLREAAAQVLVDQDHARALLAQAQRLVREQLEAAQLQASQQTTARLVAAQLQAGQPQAGPLPVGQPQAGPLQTAQPQAGPLQAAQADLTRLQSSLDDVSATVTRVLTPVQTRRTAAAAAVQGPVLALLEATGGGLPAGYARSGQVLSGQASWYGPGFVGSPTASGAPYDPERLTCANKELPLGTVLHVSANGRSVNCLVNDRGPYVGVRILDMSRAGSRALGYDGVADVTIEVLAPV